LSVAFRAFYACYEANRLVEASRAHEFDLDAASALAVEILRNDDDFFGLIDEQDTTLQFLRDGDAAWMEIPVPDEQGSYGKQIAVQDVPALIAGLQATIVIEQFEGLQFQSW
jgi:hypothetical protein